SSSTLNRSPVKAEASPSKKAGRFAAHDSVQGCDALLAVEKQQTDATVGSASPYRRHVRLGLPQQEATDRIPLVERAHDTAHLIAVPHVAALYLGQEHRPVVDLIQEHRECGHHPSRSWLEDPGLLPYDNPGFPYPHLYAS